LASQADGSRSFSSFKNILACEKYRLFGFTTIIEYGVIPLGSAAPLPAVLPGSPQQNNEAYQIGFGISEGSANLEYEGENNITKSDESYRLQTVSLIVRIL
jgi:hypothetical protein